MNVSYKTHGTTKRKFLISRKNLIMLFKIITVIDFDLVVEKYVKKNYILKEFKDTGKDVKSTNKTLIVLIVTFRLACGLCSLDGSKLHPLPWYLPN